MARSGVTYTNIADAATQLEGRGQFATVDAVRQILGTGSRTTIANHLKAWKAQYPTVSHNEMPHELSSHVKGLWERVQATADSRIQEIEQLAQQKIDSLQAILEHERIDYQALDDKLQETEIHYQDQVKQTEKYRGDLSQSDQLNAKLETQNSVLNEQLQQYKDENERLHKINTRLQDNLENIQSELLKLQQDHMQSLNMQRFNFANQTQILEQANSYLREQFKLLEIEKLDVMNALKAIKEKMQLIEQMNKQEKDKIEEMSHELINLKIRNEMLAQELNITKQDLKEKTFNTIELERKNAVVDEQLSSLKNVIKDLELSKELLAANCQQLAQENVKLHNRLSQKNK